MTTIEIFGYIILYILTGVILALPSIAISIFLDEKRNNKSYDEEMPLGEKIFYSIFLTTTWPICLTIAVFEIWWHGVKLFIEDGKN